MKKLFSFLLALAMVLSMGLTAVAEGDLPYTTEPGVYPIITDPDNAPTLTIAATRAANQYTDYADLPFWKMVCENTGVKIEWIEIPSTAVAEKVNLMLSTGNELPDVFLDCINNDRVATYYDQDVLVDVTDLIDKYVPNLKKVWDEHPSYKAEAVCPNGGIYGFPYIEEMYGLVLTSGPFCINQAWLDQLGLEMPTTTEEFKNVLIAFRDAGDLNGNGEADEVPYALSFGATDNYCSFDTFWYMMSAFGQNGSAGGGRNNDYLIATPEDGVIFTAYSDAFRKCCEYFNELYKENLIDVNSFALGADPATPLYVDKLKVTDVAVYGAMGVWSPENTIINREVRDQYTGLQQLAGPDGDLAGVHVNISEQQQIARVAITVDCEYPELVALLVNYLYEPEVSVQGNWNMAGYIRDYDENGVLTVNLDEDGNIIFPEGSGWTSVSDASANTRGSKSSTIVLNSYYDVYTDYDYAAKTLLAWQRLNGKEYILENYYNYPNIVKTMDEQAIISQVYSNVRSVVESYRMDFIRDGVTDEKWNSYLADLETAGVQQLIDAHQTAYDRYKEAMGL